MTQTEKTEALKELRFWLLDGHLRLTVDDIAALKKEFARILESKDVPLLPSGNITMKVYTELLDKGVSLHYSGWELYREDDKYHIVNNSNGHAQESSDLIKLLETIELL